MHPQSRFCGPERSRKAKFPTSEQADQFWLGAHSIAKDRGASFVASEDSDQTDAQADLSLL